MHWPNIDIAKLRVPFERHDCVNSGKKFNDFLEALQRVLGFRQNEKMVLSEKNNLRGLSFAVNADLAMFSPMGAIL